MAADGDAEEEAEEKKALNLALNDVVVGAVEAGVVVEADGSFSQERR